MGPIEILLIIGVLFFLWPEPILRVFGSGRFPSSNRSSMPGRSGARSLFGSLPRESRRKIVQATCLAVIVGSLVLIFWKK